MRAYELYLRNKDSTTNVCQTTKPVKKINTVKVLIDNTIIGQFRTDWNFFETQSLASRREYCHHNYGLYRDNFKPLYRILLESDIHSQLSFPLTADKNLVVSIIISFPLTTLDKTLFLVTYMIEEIICIGEEFRI